MALFKKKQKYDGRQATEALLTRLIRLASEIEGAHKAAAERLHAALEPLTRQLETPLQPPFAEQQSRVDAAIADFEAKLRRAVNEKHPCCAAALAEVIRYAAVRVRATPDDLNAAYHLKLQHEWYGDLAILEQTHLSLQDCDMHEEELTARLAATPKSEAPLREALKRQQKELRSAREMLQQHLAAVIAELGARDKELRQVAESQWQTLHTLCDSLWQIYGARIETPPPKGSTQGGLDMSRLNETLLG